MESKFSPIVTIPSWIHFAEPTMLHPKDKHGETIASVAKELEDRFKILSKFYKKYKPQILKIIIKNVQLSWKYGQDQKMVNETIGEEIKNLYREFMLRQEHGIRTKPAIAKNRQSFIDTGAYVAGMLVKID